MIKTVLVDKSQNSKELLSSYLKNAAGIDFIACFDNLCDIENFDNIDLIIFNISLSDEEETLKQINEIKQKNENIKFIALSDDMDSMLAKNTLNNGVSDFLFKPVIGSILEASIKKINFSKKIKEEQTIKKAKTISVFSLKGGVGKTSVAVNLAYEIEKKTNKNVCLLDFNSSSSDCALFLGLNSNNNIDDLLNEFQYSNKEKTLSLFEKFQNTNLYVLSAASDSLDFKITPSKINLIINSLKNIFDYIIIDTYCAYDENNLAVLNSSDLILYISILSQNVIKSTQSMMEMFSKIGYNQEKIKLILNRYAQDSQISIEEFEKEVNKEVFITLPNNYLTMSDAINRQNPLDITNPQSNIAKAFKKLALSLDEIDINALNSTKQYNHGIYNIIRKMGE